MIRSVGLLALILFCTACQTEGPTTAEKDPEDRYSPVDQVHAAVTRRLGKIEYESGQQLLDTLQQIIRYGELAHDPIVQAIPTASERKLANLIWLLGYVGGDKAHPILVQHLGHANLGVRYEAAAGLATMGDLSGVPVLLELLEAEKKHLRYKAHEALASTTGMDFGYVSNASVADRQRATRLWRRWWSEERSRIFTGESAR